jgi:hypothetical protein
MTFLDLPTRSRRPTLERHATHLLIKLVGATTTWRRRSKAAMLWWWRSSAHLRWRRHETGWRTRSSTRRRWDESTSCGRWRRPKIAWWWRLETAHGRQWQLDLSQRDLINDCCSASVLALASSRSLSMAFSSARLSVASGCKICRSF